MSAFPSHVRSRLLAGLFLILPLLVSLWLISLLFGVVDSLIEGVRSDAPILTSLPPLVARWAVRLAALGIVLLALYVVGTIGTLVIGRRLMSFGESLVERIPMVGGVYRATRQLSEALHAGSASSFRRCVLIAFPHPGSYTVGFVSNERVVMAGRPERRCLSIFVPTTPNPTSGFFVLVPEDDCLPLRLSIDEAIKVLVSGGIFLPADDLLRSATSSADPRLA